ncbi:MAG: class I SAM-dependent RNA methyltransferase [Firmicutes bacterium]|nr:class I SAM-dependent RNA methyltransferase [Bacillota bacterium]
MANLELIATATFGLEAVVKREVQRLGYTVLRSEDAKITFAGDEAAIPRANLWLRCADRVLVKMGEFRAESFEELFQGTKALPWEEWIPEDGKFTVNGTSVKSKLFSLSDCQKIIKKSIVERMKQRYPRETFPETGALYSVRFTILKDVVTLSIDTSGAGLHKRGYRTANVQAPIKETLAAAMVELSFWNPDRVLVDPFCGSGTILIEAAMIGKNIAPGLSRSFASEQWERIGEARWKEARTEAFRAIDNNRELQIYGSDIDPKAVSAARVNASRAGLSDDIIIRRRSFEELKLPQEHPIIITNPPYGERIGDKEALERIYYKMDRILARDRTVSLYLITADKEFERAIRSRKKADRRRKLYNGRIETTFYQYYGEKPIRPKGKQINDHNQSNG